MRKFCRFFVLISLFVFSFGFFIQAVGFGEDALKYLIQISRIQRGAFTEGEVYTADYLGRILRDLGYDTTFEEIVFPQDTILNFTQGDYLSHNIIATKKGSSDLEVIIGAAYDSEEVKGSTGFEGATGVSLLLELAKKLKDVDLPYTLKFVLFGAGKQGNIGSTHYVSTRSQDELNKVMYYLNLSSIGSGKELHVYANNGEKGFLREDYLKLSKELNISLSTSPSMEDYDIPEGVGYDIGEHVPFKYSNVPYGFIEATSWDSVYEEFQIPDDPTGEKIGVIDGSSYDNYDEVMKIFGDNVRNNLSKASELIYNGIVKKEKSIKIITVLTEKNLNNASSISYTLFKDGKKLKTSTLDENLIVEFKNLDEGNYKIEVSAPNDIKFLKDINDFEFNFDCDGEFVIVNDELDAYTYREEFTDNYISVRENIQNTQFEVGIKNVLFDYSSASEGDFQEDTDLNKNDQLIKVLSVVLVILVVVYILLRIIFSIMNKKVK